MSTRAILRRLRGGTTDAPAVPTLALDDVQAGIVTGLGRHPCSGFVFHSLPDDVAQARRVVRGLRDLGLTSAQALDDDRSVRRGTAADNEATLDAVVNIGFTMSGLRKLGVEGDVLRYLPTAFREGMAARGAALGDTGPNARPYWDAPLRGEVAVVLMVSAVDEPALDAVLARAAADGPGQQQRLGEQRGHRPADFTEPFGFRDGMSNPVIAGSGRAVPPGNGIQLRDRWEPLPAGEVLCGHRDIFGTVAGHPRALGLTGDGSFLVWRKLEQRVDGFAALCTRLAAELGCDATRAGELIVGRSRGGTPLARCPVGETNAFSYADDPHGSMTPLTSHIRRANPRHGMVFGREISDTHRIVRRGVPYHDDTGQGLLFLCYQTDLARQFEFVQSRWLNDGDAFGLGREPDAVAGMRRPSGPADDTWSELEATSVRIRRADGTVARCTAEPLVRLRGGAYFLVPAISVVDDICAGTVRAAR